MASSFTALDDASFTLPTHYLISPISICKLELDDATDQETPEDADALVNPHLQRRPLPGPREVLPANTDEDLLMGQVIFLATTLKIFQELECYIYYVSESEPVPEDSEVDEADDELQ